MKIWGNIPQADVAETMLFEQMVVISRFANPCPQGHSNGKFDNVIYKEIVV